MSGGDLKALREKLSRRRRLGFLLLMCLGVALLVSLVGCVVVLTIVPEQVRMGAWAPERLFQHVRFFLFSLAGAFLGFWLWVLDGYRTDTRLSRLIEQFSTKEAP